MRGLTLFIIYCTVLALSSCTMIFGAYIRNMASETAVIDVFLLDKTDLKTLPNKVTTANRLVKFKSGFRKFLDSTQNVIWIDVSHFKLEMRANTTVDLSDMAGKFINSSPRGDVIVTVTLKNKVDTLINGRRDFRHEKFEYKNAGFSSPLLHYDIKD